MDWMTILAQAAESANEGAEAAEQSSIVPINWFWGHITGLSMLEALTFISFGTVCLLYGWRVFKVLVVISFGLIGMILGVALTQRIVGLNNQLMGGLVGMGVLAVMSVPLMRWAVSVLGAVAGAILTSGIWYACGLNEQYIWAGGMVGLVAGGMISFIVFRVAVILFASLWGSGLMVTGTLALLHLYSATQAQVEAVIFNQRWFLPTALTLTTFVGIIVQHKFVKGSKEWNL
jgi:hypothetical protein